jgi:P4 family phage/plasmid primase-like protien
LSKKNRASTLLSNIFNTHIMQQEDRFDNTPEAAGAINAPNGEESMIETRETENDSHINIITKMGAVNAPASIEGINFKHVEHLRSEGFTDEHLKRMAAAGVRSITSAEAKDLGICCRDDAGKYHNPSGLYFPFTDKFGQVRCDNPPIRDGKPAKYVTQSGKGKSQAWLHAGVKVITEGYKDAAAGTVHGGIPTGALAGVSHARRSLPANSKYTFIFDHDGWTNHQVFSNLVVAALHTGGKVQIVPEVEGHPKAGLCEYFKSGKTPADYKALITSAMKPADFLMELPRHWKGLPLGQFQRCMTTLLKLAVAYLPAKEHGPLLKQVELVAKPHGYGVRDLRAMLGAEMRKRHRAEQARLNKRAIADQKIPVKYSEDGSPKLPATSAVARFLSGKHKGTLTFNQEHQRFYGYKLKSDGLWSLMPDINSLIQSELDKSDLIDLYGADYVKSVGTLMKGYLSAEEMAQPTRLVPFLNGVYDLDSGLFSEHSASYGFTWQLPYKFDPLATCQPIIDWLTEAQDGDAQRVRYLLAWAKAIVTSRVELQKFLYLLGSPGSGKGTFMRLIVALVGDVNVHITTLKRLEENRFETASIYGKRLVAITDCDEWHGDVGTLKALTGQDPLPLERKNKQQDRCFRASAMTLMAGNSVLRCADRTGAIDRRQNIAPFNLVVGKDAVRDLESEFEPYLPGFMNLVLSIPDDEMVRLIRETDRYVPSLRDSTREAKVDSDTLAAWLDECCVFVEGVRTKVGGKTKITVSEEVAGERITRHKYDRADEYLYPNYVTYCEEHGHNPTPEVKFGKALEALIRTLGEKSVRRLGRTMNGYFWEGIQIRTLDHDHLPCPITGNQPDNEPSMNHSMNHSMNQKPAPSGAYEPYEPFSQLIHKGEKNIIKDAAPSNTLDSDLNNSCGGAVISCENGSLVHKPCPVTVSAIPDGSSVVHGDGSLAESHPTAPPPQKNEEGIHRFKVGDRCEALSPLKKIWVAATIVELPPPGRCDYLTRPDSPELVGLAPGHGRHEPSNMRVWQVRSISA